MSLEAKWIAIHSEFFIWIATRELWTRKELLTICRRVESNFAPVFANLELVIDTCLFVRVTLEKVTVVVMAKNCSVCAGPCSTRTTLWTFRQSTTITRVGFENRSIKTHAHDCRASNENLWAIRVLTSVVWILIELGSIFACKYRSSASMRRLLFANFALGRVLENVVSTLVRFVLILTSPRTVCATNRFPKLAVASNGSIAAFFLG